MLSRRPVSRSALSSIEQQAARPVTSSTRRTTLDGFPDRERTARSRSAVASRQQRRAETRRVHELDFGEVEDQGRSSTDQLRDVFAEPTGGREVDVAAHMNDN